MISSKRYAGEAVSYYWNVRKPKKTGFLDPLADGEGLASAFPKNQYWLFRPQAFDLAALPSLFLPSQIHRSSLPVLLNAPKLLFIKTV